MIPEVTFRNAHPSDTAMYASLPRTTIPAGVPKVGEDRRPAIASNVTAVTRSSEGRDVASYDDAADRAIPDVRDQHTAAGVDGHAHGAIEARARGRPAVAAVAAGRASSDRRDHTARHPAHGAHIRDIERPRSIERDPGRDAQAGCGGWAAIAGDVAGPVAHHGGYRAGHHLADAAVTGIGDMQIAAAVERQAGGVIQACELRLATFSREPANAISGERSHHAADDLTDGAVVGVSDVEVAAYVECDGGGMTEVRAERGLSVVRNAAAYDGGDSAGRGGACRREREQPS